MTSSGKSIYWKKRAELWRRARSKGLSKLPLSVETRLKVKYLPQDNHPDFDPPDFRRWKSKPGQAKASLAPVELEFDESGLIVQPDVSKLDPRHAARYLRRWSTKIDEFLQSE